MFNVGDRVVWGGFICGTLTGRYGHSSWNIESDAGVRWVIAESELTLLA